MNQTIQFCPECGDPVPDAVKCKKCGYDGSTSKIGSPFTTEKRLNRWTKVKAPIKWIGTYAWLITSIIAFGFFIFGFIRIFTRNSLWSFIFWGIAFGLSIYFLKPYSEKYKEEQWYYLVNDVWVLGKLRIPKLLILSISIDILLLGFGGLFVVIPIILVIFLGPTPIKWLTDTILGAPRPSKEAKSKKEKKSKPKEELVKSKPPKEKIAKPIEKKTKQTQDLSEKSQKITPEKSEKQDLYDQFKKETNKKAIWKNKETKAFIEWEKTQSNASED